MEGYADPLSVINATTEGIGLQDDKGNQIGQELPAEMLKRAVAMVGKDPSMRGYQENFLSTQLKIGHRTAGYLMDHPTLLDPHSPDSLVNKYNLDANAISKPGGLSFLESLGRADSNNPNNKEDAFKEALASIENTFGEKSQFSQSLQSIMSGSGSFSDKSRQIGTLVSEKGATREDALREGENIFQNAIEKMMGSVVDLLGDIAGGILHSPFFGMGTSKYADAADGTISNWEKAKNSILGTDPDKDYPVSSPEASPAKGFDSFKENIRKAAMAHNIDPGLYAATIERESHFINGGPPGIDKNTGKKNYGLAQLSEENIKGIDPNDVDKVLDKGASILQEALRGNSTEAGVRKAMYRYTGNTTVLDNIKDFSKPVNIDEVSKNAGLDYKQYNYFKELISHVEKNVDRAGYFNDLYHKEDRKKYMEAPPLTVNELMTGGKTTIDINHNVNLTDPNGNQATSQQSSVVVPGKMNKLKTNNIYFSAGR